MEEGLPADELEDAGREDSPRQLEVAAQVLRLHRPLRQERRKRAATRHVRLQWSTIWASSERVRMRPPAMS